ncbi:hypothetical protein M9H77_26073 [Catharanthus roseus]|uniref:Uncharacterized protein n=1 Tax=Catharanthus roseus TaxID=4058 RepID=A0ACC0A8S0_CATRO|nr:hypothetical protein M9H77_26073 [Catharanthus roseus]
MASLKCLLCLILLLFTTSTITESRPIKSITLARVALEAQFKRDMLNESAFERPERTAPSGPDPHHHFEMHV